MLCTAGAPPFDPRGGERSMLPMSENAARAVIARLGLPDLGRVFGASQRRLAAAAVRRAGADAGLPLTHNDGLLICPGVNGGLGIRPATALRLPDLAPPRALHH